MPKKRKTVTASGDSDPQGPACGGDIVPVPPTSSSHEGPTGVLPTSTPVETALAEECREEVGRKGGAGKATPWGGVRRVLEGGTGKPGPLSSKLWAKPGGGAGEGARKSGPTYTDPWWVRNPDKFREGIVDILQGMMMRTSSESVGNEDVGLYLKKLVEDEATRLSSYLQGPTRELASLRKEVEELRAEIAGLRASAQTPASPPVTQGVSVGVQACPTPTTEDRRSVGVQSSLHPTNKDRGCQTPRKEEVGRGGDTWSVDRVAALIDRKTRALRDEIVAEVCGGAGRALPPPARKKEEPPRPSVPGPVPPSEDGVPWSRVLGRRERKRVKEGARPAPRPSQPSCGVSGGGTDGAGREARRKPRLPRPPGTAAIVLAPVGGAKETAVEDAAHAAMGSIALEDYGVPGGLKVKKTVTGGLLLQIPGEEAAAKADKLAAGIREILAQKGVTGVRVDRPVKLADVRVTGLVGSVTPEKVAETLAEFGGCGVGEVRVGAIRRAPLSLGSAWARLPVSAARRVVATGMVSVGGWMSIGVTPVDIGPMRCYRCLRVGHAGRRCTAKEDRGGRCFRCGEPGHLAKACAAPTVRCPLCADLGRRSDHRLGAAACTRPPRGGDVGGGRLRVDGGLSASATRPTQRGKGRGGEISPPPKGDGGAARTCSSDRTEAREGREEEEDPAASSVAEVDMEVSPLPQRGQRVVQRGAKRPAEEEEEPGPSGENAREDRKARGGVAWVVAPPHS